MRVRLLFQIISIDEHSANFIAETWSLEEYDNLPDPMSSPKTSSLDCLRSVGPEPGQTAGGRGCIDQFNPEQKK